MTFCSAFQEMCRKKIRPTPNPQWRSRGLTAVACSEILRNALAAKADNKNKGAARKNACDRLGHCRMPPQRGLTSKLLLPCQEVGSIRIPVAVSVGISIESKIAAPL